MNEVEKIEVSFILESFKSAYVHLNYGQFLETVGGRDDPYWKEKWYQCKDCAQLLGELGSLAVPLTLKGMEWQNNKRTKVTL